MIQLESEQQFKDFANDNTVFYLAQIGVVTVASLNQDYQS